VEVKLFMGRGKYALFCLLIGLGIIIFVSIFAQYNFYEFMDALDLGWDRIYLFVKIPLYTIVGLWLLWWGIVWLAQLDFWWYYKKKR